MGLYMVCTYNFLCTSIFHSPFQFFPIWGEKIWQHYKVFRCFVNSVLAFKVPGYRSEEMLNTTWCIFISAHFPFCKWQRTDILIQTTYSRLTLHTIETTYLYFTGLQGLPVSYEKMRFTTQNSYASLPWIDRSWWNDWYDYAENFLAVINYCADRTQSLW